MNNRNHHCMPLAGQLVDSSHVGFMPPEALPAGASSLMRHVSARGVAPVFFDHIKALATQPLGEAARQLSQAHCDALSNPLGNATPSAIAEQTPEFAISIGMHAAAPKPAMSLPKKKGLGLPQMSRK